MTIANRDGRCCSTVGNTGEMCSLRARPGSALCQRCADFIDHSIRVNEHGLKADYRAADDTTAVLVR